MIKAAKESFNVMNGEELEEGYSAKSREKCDRSSEIGILDPPAGLAVGPPALPLKGAVVQSAPQIMAPKGSVPPPMPQKKQVAPPPPPPPLGAGKLFNQKRATGKLKRSSQMGNLFRDLKTKMEGSSLQVKPSSRTKKQLGGSAGGKEGLAASLAELTKRSPYFQQIEEDAQKHAKTILALKIAINSLQTKDMIKLIKFRENVEAFLENLTDESQVLAKFQDFPTKKLETIRTAAALYSKSNLIVSNLKKWEVKPPTGQLLHKFDCYFSKVKEELDAFERIKDEESRKFKSHGIDFDFYIFTMIKELMVDVSSSCMELALKEWRETKGSMVNKNNGCQTDIQTKGNIQLLWKAFQLAFRVYSFAGGHDDRADKLAKELANEILCDSSNQ
ncbi:hypothetical protein QQP08_014436 [Theobroma cacao]|nr:hypothetical protein QQP08_014436 [Theobroma cacao]